MSLRLSLLASVSGLAEAMDDIREIEKDPNFHFSHEDLKDLKNKLTEIKMLRSELEEKI